MIPGLGRSPGEGNGNPLQYSCLENPVDGGAWWAVVYSVTKSRTQLSMHACPGFISCGKGAFMSIQQLACWLNQPCLGSQEVGRVRATCCLLACCGNTRRQGDKCYPSGTSFFQQDANTLHFGPRRCGSPSGTFSCLHLGLRDDVGLVGLCSFPGPSLFLPSLPSFCIYWALTIWQAPCCVLGT